MPEKGVNGATYLTLFLNQFNFADGAAAFIKVGAEKLLEDHEGERLGTAYVDELMGNTSMNAGVWSFDENSEGKIALNFRFPQGNSPERMQEILLNLMVLLKLNFQNIFMFHIMFQCQTHLYQH